MRAVLYICHGSSKRAGQEAALSFIEKTKQMVNVDIQEACFLELADPSIEQGILRCVERGATEIIAIPFLLLTAGHAKFDIPKAIQKIMTNYPDIKLYYGETLGVNERIINVLIKRMNEKGNVKDSDTVLIVGRGSSDERIHDYFKQILDIFKRKTEIADVRVCYLAACDPKFETKLSKMIQENLNQIYVLPYLLFPGFLMNFIASYISKLNSSIPIHLCDSLGYDDEIGQVLAERVEEAITRKVNIIVPINY